jgi:hypothetical protein
VRQSRFAFVFYATQWRPDLWEPLHACIHSLDSRGGAAAEYDRILIYSEAITPEIESFCARHRLQVRYEPRFTYRISYPNKGLMLRPEGYEALCLTDLDICFLADPTPMFERVAAEGKVLTVLDRMVPLRPWPSLPPAWERRLRWEFTPRLWRAQYRRFAGRGAQAAPERPWPEAGTLPYYFNDGVVFVPGPLARRLEEAWRAVALAWIRDVAWHRPFTAFFVNHFVSQISYSIALHAYRIPWAVLPVTHNFIPTPPPTGEDLRVIAADEVVLAHMVTPVRHWLNPADERAPEEEWLLPLYRRVRAVIAELPPDG